MVHKKIILMICSVMLVFMTMSYSIAQEVVQESEALHMVVSVTEGASINRSNWQAGVFEPLLPGITVDSTSLIRTGDAGEVIVLCGDLQTIVLFDETDTVCSPDIPDPLISTAGLQVPNRSTPQSLTLLSPFSFPDSYTRNQRPIFAWLPHPQAQSYELTIYQGVDTIWNMPNITVPEIQYPDNMPELSRDVDYSLVLTAYDQSNQMLQENNRFVQTAMNFKIIDAETLESIQAMINQIENLTDVASEEIREYIKLQYLIEKNLVREALIELGGLAPEFSSSDNLSDESPLLYLTIARAYRLNGVPLVANNAYAYALEIALTLGNSEAAAMAYQGLAATTLDGDASYCYLQQAISFYERVGDSRQVAELGNNVNNLMIEIIPLCQ